MDESNKQIQQPEEERTLEEEFQELEQVLACGGGPGGGRSLLRFRRRKERYLPPQYGGPSPLGGTGRPGADRKRPAVEAPL